MEVEKRDKAIQAISKDPYRIIKTNPIINAKFDITAVQMKVFLKIIASIDQSKDDVTEVDISMQELKKFVGTNSKNIYGFLQKELLKLKATPIYYEDDTIRLDANFISAIEYNKKSGVFNFEIPKKLKPFLLQIKENFTVLDIRNLLYLDSIYAIRFYEFCKEYERFKHFEFDVDELKEKFGLTDRYKNYFDFKLKVIQQARMELIANSELYFDFEEIKQGKKVVRLRFTIIKNNKRLKRQEEETQDTETQIHIKEVYSFVKEYVSEETVITWFGKYPYEQIKKGVQYTLNEHKKGKVDDVAKHLQKMVSVANLHDANEIKKQAEKKKREQAQNEQQQHRQQREVEQIQQNLKAEYAQKKLQLATSLIQAQPTLHTQLLETLRQEYEQENRSISVELSLNNYKPKVGVSSIEEFLDNFSVGGMFQAYVLEKLTAQFKDFQDLRNEYIPKAKEIRLKEKDFF